jgi:hypothetical protein
VSELRPNVLSPEQEVGPSAEELLKRTTEPLNTQLNLAVSHELQGADARLVADALLETQNAARLSQELAGDAANLSEDAKMARSDGETAESLLSQARSSYSLFEQLKAGETKSLDFETQLNDAREGYVDALTKRPRLRGRKERRQHLVQMEQAYNGAVVNKIEQVMAMDPNHRKAPYVPEVVSNLNKENPNPTELTENHFHVLVDQLAREQLLKKQAIENRSNRGTKRLLHVLETNRALRIAVGGAIWAGSVVATNKGLLPRSSEFVSNDLEKVLPLVAGYFTGKDVIGAAGDSIDKFRRQRRIKKDVGVLVGNTFLTERALGTIYSGVEYQEGRIKNRSAGQTEEEHRKAFSNIDTEFSKLQAEGARGGKPYTAADVLGYVTDLYVHRKAEIDSVLASDDPRAAFLGLCGEVIAADSQKLTRERQSNRSKQLVYRSLALAGSVLANQWMLQASRAKDAIAEPSLKFAAQ